MAVRLVKKMYAEGKRGSRRPKKRWMDVIECDMKKAGVSVDHVGDRVK